MMTEKEIDGPFGFLIKDALSNLGESDQKPVNVRNESRGLLSDTRGAIMAEPVSENVSEAESIRWFSEISNKDIRIAGGKGASLGEMFNHEFPVPPGFVITAQAYEYFIKKAGLDEKIKEIISKIDFENTEELNKASQEIRKDIENEEFPKELKDEILESYHILSSEKINESGVSEDALNILKNSQEPIFVSIRSSATAEDLADASFAGQQESFLNIKGDGSLLEYIRKCMSSLFTPRAIYYRNKQGFTESLIAVVVQKMIDSEKSGVIFSKDPIKRTDNIAIEAVFGLGEGIVGGRIKPDYYRVTRDLKIEEVKVTEKKIAIVRTGSGQNETVKLSDDKSKSQVLTNAEVLEAANYAIKLEEHYKKPQDIEFAIEGGEFFVIQSRPITTLEKKEGEEKELTGKIILEGLGASPGIGVGNVRVIENMEDLTKIKKGDIMVTEMTNPDMVVSMQKATAIVTDEGGMTSHAAIVSREMGIPAIVGTSQATNVLKDGMKITVDGTNGKIYEGAIGETTLAEVKPAVETNKVKLKVILDLPDYAERAAKSGIDKIGLMRLEGIIASSGKHPLLFEKEDKLNEYSKLLEEGISKIAEHFNSIWIRSSDIRTDEFSSLEGSLEKEINPMLGFHGIRFSLKHPEILKAELQAIKNVAITFPDKKLGVMFPQIISIEEVREAKKYFDEFKIDNMEFGVMIETPASVQIIDDICEEGIDFISFGTNDLTQYTLAVDRGEDNVQYLYNELHPAIFAQIEKVIEACKKKNVETSICGQAGSNKEMAEFLFKKGIDSISVNADAAYEISVLIKELEEKDIDSSEKDESEVQVSEEDVSNITQERERESQTSEGSFQELEDTKTEEESEVEEKEEGVNEPTELKSDTETGPVVEDTKTEESIEKEDDGDWDKKARVSFEVEADIKEPSSSSEDTKDTEEENTGNKFPVSSKTETQKLKISDPSTYKKLKSSGDFEVEADIKEPSSSSEQEQTQQSKLSKKKQRKKEYWKKRKERRKKWKEENRENKEESEDNYVDVNTGNKFPVSSKTETQKLKTSKSKDFEVSENKVFSRISDPSTYKKLKPFGDKQADSLLNEENIQVSAEREGIDESEYEKNIGPIEPFDNLDRIQDKAEDLQEEIKEDNLEDLEKKHEMEEGIKVESERIDEGFKEESEEENEIGGQTKESSSEDVEDIKAEQKEEQGEAGSVPKETEDIGVYNPDEEEDESKSKYKYNFDDFE